MRVVFLKIYYITQQTRDAIKNYLKASHNVLKIFDASSFIILKQGVNGVIFDNINFPVELLMVSWLLRLLFG